MYHAASTSLVTAQRHPAELAQQIISNIWLCALHQSYGIRLTKPSMSAIGKLSCIDCRAQVPCLPVHPCAPPVAYVFSVTVWSCPCIDISIRSAASRGMLPLLHQHSIWSLLLSYAPRQRRKLHTTCHWSSGYSKSSTNVRKHSSS